MKFNIIIDYLNYWLNYFTTTKTGGSVTISFSDVAYTLCLIPALQGYNFVVTNASIA